MEVQFDSTGGDYMETSEKKIKRNNVHKYVNVYKYIHTLTKGVAVILSAALFERNMDYI